MTKFWMILMAMICAAMFSVVGCDEDDPADGDGDGETEGEGEGGAEGEGEGEGGGGGDDPFAGYDCDSTDDPTCDSMRVPERIAERDDCLSSHQIA